MLMDKRRVSSNHRVLFEKVALLSLRCAVLICLLLFAIACTPSNTTSITPATSLAPSVDFKTPENNTTLPLNQRVAIYAIVQDPNGIVRADFIVDGVIIHTQTLTVTTRRFDYSYQWLPNALGQHNLLVIGHNSKGQVGTSGAHVVNVVAFGTPAPTNNNANVITPFPQSVVTVVTSAPPTLLPPLFVTSNPGFVTATLDLSPILKKLTPTLTPTPIVIPFGQPTPTP